MVDLECERSQIARLFQAEKGWFNHSSLEQLGYKL